MTCALATTSPSTVASARRNTRLRPLRTTWPRTRTWAPYGTERTSEALYCATATRFTADLRRPPVLVLVPAAAAARAGKAARVPFTLDKISSVSLVATRGRELVFARTARFARGRHAFALPKLRKAGDLTLRLRAVDAAGNASAVAGRLAVRAGAEEQVGLARP